MEIVNPFCAGIDVHKKTMTVCLYTRNGAGERRSQTRTFETSTHAILRAKDWLVSHGCEVVAIESTSVYWKPVFNLLEDSLKVILVNPAAIKQAEGRKTDVGDSEWLAELLEHGLLRPSFIPAAEIRDLRDLTRYRSRLVQERSSEVQRVQKTLEDCNIKLSSVATDIMGVSGRAILDELIAGKKTPAEMAELTRGRLRHKKQQMEQALIGVVRPHHAWLLAHMLEHIDLLDQSIEECEAKIEEMCRPFSDLLELLDTVPGIHRMAAQQIIAEIGTDMSYFPDERHLCSWAGVCPGNNQSGGKRRSGHTRHGNPWLRPVLVQCAHAAARKKGTYLQAQFRRFIRKGAKKAAVVVAHSILQEIYHIIKDRKPHYELGPDYFNRLHKESALKYHLSRIQELGYQVLVQPASSEASALA